MRVLMTGGGSAGHITPILSVASELKKRHPDAEIRYVGQFGDTLSSIITNEPSITGMWAILAGKWRRYHGIGFWAHIRDWKAILFNARDLILFSFGFLQSIWLLLWWRPDTVFVKGGYVGLPVGLAAALLRIPIVTHDSDVLPGLTNRILSRFAAKQCVGLPVRYYKSYAPDKTVQTGVPLREEYIAITPLLQAEAKESLGMPKDSKVLTVIGGSLGAVRINNAIMHASGKILQNKNIVILHLCGSRQFEEVDAFYKSLPKEQQNRVKVWSFIEEVYRLTAAADLVISRAGATFIAELGTQKKPTIVIPNPVLTGGHQTYNAKLLLADNSVLVVNEDQLDSKTFDFGEYIEAVLADTKKLHTIANNLHKNTKPRAAANIAKIIAEVATQ